MRIDVRAMMLALACGASTVAAQIVPRDSRAPTPGMLVVRTQPAGAESGVMLATQPVIEVRDRVNVLLPAATNVVTVAIASGTATLSGTTTVNASGGVARFTNLKLAGSGPVTLRFTSTPEITAVNAAAFAVVQTVRQSGSDSPLPMTATSGAKLAPVRWFVKDGAGLPINGATVVARVVTGPSVLSGTTTVTTANGLAVFDNLTLTGVGTTSLSYRVNGTTDLTGLPIVVSAQAAAAASPPPATGPQSIACPQTVDVTTRYDVPAGSGQVVGHLMPPGYFVRAMASNGFMLCIYGFLSTEIMPSGSATKVTGTVTAFSLQNPFPAGKVCKVSTTNQRIFDCS